mmetsp:Transcript_10174/g.22410  ORF Transcript_10174/g.22410 Transcript_10174/m.22410 type:complete len:216 (+) Transcript_10174:1247-1894(+)
MLMNLAPQWYTSRTVMMMDLRRCAFTLVTKKAMIFSDDTLWMSQTNARTKLRATTNSKVAVTTRSEWLAVALQVTMMMTTTTTTGTRSRFHDAVVVGVDTTMRSTTVIDDATPTMMMMMSAMIMIPLRHQKVDVQQSIRRKKKTTTRMNLTMTMMISTRKTKSMIFTKKKPNSWATFSSPTHSWIPWTPTEPPNDFQKLPVTHAFGSTWPCLSPF